MEEEVEIGNSVVKVISDNDSFLPDGLLLSVILLYNKVISSMVEVGSFILFIIPVPSMETVSFIIGASDFLIYKELYYVMGIYLSTDSEGFPIWLLLHPLIVTLLYPGQLDALFKGMAGLYHYKGII